MAMIDYGFGNLDNDNRCSKCGSVLCEGEWPFCPHGFPTGVGLSVVPDSIPGGMVIENLTPQPVTVYSRTEHKDLMRRTGNQPFVRHKGEPGSDKSKLTQRWV